MNITDSERTCRLDTQRLDPEPALFFVFGASGDLAKRKIFPALWDLFLEKRLPVGMIMVGAARRPYTTDEFHSAMREACRAWSRHKAEVASDAEWQAFARGIFYLQIDVEQATSYESIRRLVLERDSTILQELPADTVLPANVLYYLAVTPDHFPVIVEHLGACGCGSVKDSVYGDGHKEGWRRLVIEKPYGRDYQSARQLSALLHRHFKEEDIYRIDHYLGKEAVQNLLYFRFANAVFEPIWNRNYIKRIEITVVEREGIGTRGGYYDHVGAARDMIQNHLTQLLCLTVMEPPASLLPEHIRDEKVKVLRAIPRYSPSEILARARRGQYASYRTEPKVDPASITETFVSLTVSIENWRFAGVPITLRTGKALAEKFSEIVIHFHRPPDALFAALCGEKLGSNRMIVRIQPDEGIWLDFNAKIPGEPALGTNSLRFSYREVSNYFPEAYERLILDALAGDSTLFIRSDESELAWQLIDQLEEAWTSADAAASPEHGGLVRYPDGCPLADLRAMVGEP